MDRRKFINLAALIALALGSGCASISKSAKGGDFYKSLLQSKEKRDSLIKGFEDIVAKSVEEYSNKKRISKETSNLLWDYQQKIENFAESYSERMNTYSTNQLNVSEIGEVQSFLEKACQQFDKLKNGTQGHFDNGTKLWSHYKELTAIKEYIESKPQ